MLFTIETIVTIMIVTLMAVTFLIVGFNVCDRINELPEKAFILNTRQNSFNVRV